jgi:hypothetical protein
VLSCRRPYRTGIRPGLTLWDVDLKDGAACTVKVPRGNYLKVRTAIGELDPQTGALRRTRSPHRR